MKPYTFHISLYDPAFLGVIFIGINFMLLLWFTKKTNQDANRFLALALGIIVLWIARILAIDIGLPAQIPGWSSLPLRFSMALGPLFFLYVLKITRPDYKFHFKDLIHFSPLSIELYSQLKFNQLDPVLPWLAFFSIGTYLYFSRRLIEQFYLRINFIGGDRYRYEMQWLHNLVTAFSLIWLLWIPLKAADYFYDLTPSAYYPFYLLLSIMAIWMAVVAYMRPEAAMVADSPLFLKPPLPLELKQKGIWLRKTVKDQLYYQDPELSLNSLAEKLGWTPHELSRIINTVIKKSFHDFISEFRVSEVIEKMKDPGHDHLTFLGIAYDSGFNSKSTFNRIFKEMTGKTPAQYKSDLKKGIPVYKLRPRVGTESVILSTETIPNWFHLKLTRYIMFRNYYKTAWRNLLRNKFYTGINIAGLTLGLTIGILILLWVQDELGFDGFYKKAKDIYRVELWGGTGNNRQIFTVGVAPIGPFSKEQLPEVQDYVRLIGNYDYSLYKYKDKVFGDEQVMYADPSLFTMFDLTLVKGDNAKPFYDDNSVVITRSTAEKFFGDLDPLGQVIRGDDKVNLTVSGVIPDMPKNSSIQFDMVMPISFHFNKQLAQKNDMSNNFSYFSYITFLHIKPGSDLKKLARQITGVHLKHSPKDTDADYLLLPLTKMRLFNADMSDNGIGTVRIFIAIAILILVIACINYVNLSTARAMLRAKEISIRKVVGAAKTQLFMQFIVETALLFVVAAVLALGMIYILMPVFNRISGKEMSLHPGDFHLWVLLLTAITGTLAASSIYPALLLASFEPLKALKGKISAGVGDVLFRKILVVTQFSFAIILIIGTIVITRQLNFIRSTGVGYDKTHVVTFWMRDMDKHYDVVKAELLKQPGVSAVTRSNQNIVNFQGFTGNEDWDGKDPKHNIIMHPIGVDRDLVSFFKMTLVEGMSFTGGQMDTAHYILNEAAIKEMGIKDPIGKRFRMGGNTGTIVGVVKDFHYSSMKEKIAPSIFWFAPQYLNRIYIKTTAIDAQKVISAAGKQFKHYNGEFPFDYSFLDDIFDTIYKSEERQGTLFTYFSAIAIFISCLGLLGLTAYTAQVRTREIGVRKVLGASVSSIIRLLALDFIKLVFIAITLATPIAWYFMYNWLQDFAYRISINWSVFALAGALAIFIAFVTISFQAIKTALVNPVKSIRSE